MSPAELNEEVAHRAGQLVREGYHWSEGFMLAVGEHLWGELPPLSLKMTTGFSGGVGLTHQQLCGALTAGIMVLGGLYGRTEPAVDDTFCQQLVIRYRDRFQAELGALNCCDLRAERFGSHNEEPCWMLVRRAARLLLAVVAEAEAERAR